MLWEVQGTVVGRSGSVVDLEAIIAVGSSIEALPEDNFFLRHDAGNH